jgi:hypothetical protein
VEVVDQAMDVVLIVFVDLPFDVIIFREFLYEHVAAYNVFDDMLLVKVKWDKISIHIVHEGYLQQLTQRIDLQAGPLGCTNRV